MPYPYYRPTPGHQDLHDTYIAIFDPINDTGKWAGSHHVQQSKKHTQSDFLRQQHDHLLAHKDYAVATAAIECHSECFFNTPDGLTGLCPPSARRGDLVVVLHGGRVPYLLRHQRTAGKDTIQYKFVGECYLCDYMTGRAIREQQEKNLQAEVFELA
jgi:hypothetical protein